MDTDAAKKELDGLLSAGRQACGSLQIAGSSNLTTIALTQKLLLVPGLVADWKQSSAQGGARTALTLAKAHYPEMDLDLLTSGMIFAPLGARPWIVLAAAVVLLLPALPVKNMLPAVYLRAAAEEVDDAQA